MFRYLLQIFQCDLGAYMFYLYFDASDRSIIEAVHSYCCIDITNTGLIKVIFSRPKLNNKKFNMKVVG
jgi:hypothetical protein